MLLTFMDRQYLEMLEVEMPCFNGILFDDGYVPSLSEHTKRIYFTEGIKHPNFQEGFGGRCVLTRNNNIHIFYSSFPEQDMDVLTRAHEETHALDLVNRLDLLPKKMRAEDKAAIPLEEINDAELIANLGAIYALESRGLSTEKIPSNARRVYDRFRI